MRVNPRAARRLARLLARGHTIPTNEFWEMGGVKHRVHLVHVKDIHRTDWRYVKGYKKPQEIYNFNKKNQGFLTADDLNQDHTIHNVNQMRRTLRKGSKPPLPPVHLLRAHKNSFIHKKLGKSFIVTDGHHRLTAHQAEGRKLIRAILPQYRGDDRRYYKHLFTQIPS